MKRRNLIIALVVVGLALAAFFTWLIVSDEPVAAPCAPEIEVCQ